MKFQLPQKKIKELCGRISYQRGEVYYRAGQVAFTNYSPDIPLCEAEIKGNHRYRVTLRTDRTGTIEASCTCPALRSYTNYCSHIAAVLISLHANEPRPTGSEDSGVADELMDGMLELFAGKRLPPPSSARLLIDSREPLKAEFLCNICSYGDGKTMFAIEMKFGLKKHYGVPNIRELLGRIDRGEACVMTPHFTYDPALHRLTQDQDAVIRQLIRIHRSESIYRANSGMSFALGDRIREDRLLPIPPDAWDALLPHLIESPAARLVQDDVVLDEIVLSDDPLPLRFDFDQAQEHGYQLDVHGMGTIAVMESYGYVLSEGKLLKLQPEACRRLAELKRMLEASRTNRIRVSPERADVFIEKVIPGLMKLGSVRIAEAVAGLMLRAPLKARLYLDRVRDRLLAGLEFQYGDIVFNPIEGIGKLRGEGRILVRDAETEGRILELMEMSRFVRTESGYFLEGEDEEYEFMYRIIPELEKLVQIYATSAVKVRLYTGHPPKMTVDVDERTDWLDIKFDIAGIPEADIRQVLKSLEEKRKYYRLPGGALMPLESAEFQEIVRFLNEVGIRQWDAKGAQFHLPAIHALHLADASYERGESVELGSSFRRLLDDIRNPDRQPAPVPDSLAPVLRDYQKTGFRWLKTLARYRFGGILADEMGLGKTLQSIAFLVSVLPEIRNFEQPALIVCPASLVYNWRNELRKFAPELRVAIPDGKKADRYGILKEASCADVIVTSYPLLRKDVAEYAVRPFHTLILDEAQAFKNHATQTAHAVKSISARYRFALTGTPVENHLEELWSIFDAVFPELFPDKRAFGELTREAVTNRVRPFLLRRLKTDVLKELPEKIETLQASELLPEQKKLYAGYLAKLRKESLKHLDEDGFAKSRIKILAGLTRLRQLCCHPALFVEGYTGSSAKFEQLMELVEECRSAGKRALVFSQFTEMLGLIRRELGYRGVPHFYLDGQTPSAERVELCGRFNEGECELFLISLKAGGTGLNLTGADTVILYDLWWNPAVEEQAAGRAHRIGQKKVVQVIRLVAQGTVEDKMYELQRRKRNLIEEVVRPGEEELSSLTEQELRELLAIPE
jgi:superfamily II DNA or RNA helicase